MRSHATCARLNQFHENVANALNPLLQILVEVIVIPGVTFVVLDNNNGLDHITTKFPRILTKLIELAHYLKDSYKWINKVLLLLDHLYILIITKMLLWFALEI